MFRLAFFLPLTPLLATPCLAQQFPVVPDGELPIAAIELEKMPWTRVLGVGPIEFATIVGDRARPGLYIQLVRWPPHAVLKAHSHPDDRYVMVLRGTFYHGFGEKFEDGKLEPRPAGSFFTEPKGVRHFGMTKDEEVVLLSALARRQRTISKNEPLGRQLPLRMGCLAYEWGRPIP
jgi:quercetin dioxygenase-like cupin family protein